MGALDKYHGIIKDFDACEEYGGKALKCRSLRQLIDVALSPAAMPWVASSIAKGILDRHAIAEDFANFANSGYIADYEGFTSSFHIAEDNVEVTTSISLIVDCPSVHVKRPVAELHVVGDCDISADGCAIVYTYHPAGKTTKKKYG